jgi:hypothetical protein
VGEAGLPGVGISIEDAAEDEFGDAIGLSPGTGQGERRAPGAAEHPPALDARTLADFLDAGDEIPGAVGFERRIERAPATAALVRGFTMRYFSGWKKRRCSGFEPPPGPPCGKITGLPEGLPLSSK